VRRLLFALVLQLLVLCPVGAQSTDSSKIRASSSRTRVSPPAQRRTARPARPLWSTDLTLAGVYDTNVNSDDEELATEGMAAGVVVGLRNRSVRPTLQVEYGLVARTFTETENWDRISHRAALVFDRDIGRRWSLGADGVLSLGVPTTEFRRADQLVLMPSLEFRPDSVHRVRVYVAARARSYDDSASSRALAPYAGVEYRHRWHVWRYADLSYRYETNRADLPAYRFFRATYGLDYTTPLSTRDRIRLGIVHRAERFDGQQITTVDEDGDSLSVVVVDRQDRRWTPSISWIRDFDRQWRLQADYRFLARQTNDDLVRADFESHRMSTTLRYHLGAR
jgi:hypothetical protein